MVSLSVWFFPPVNTYYKAIEKDQQKCHACTCKHRLDKDPIKAKTYSAYGCWLLFIIVTAIVPAFKAAVPPSVLITADPMCHKCLRADSFGDHM